MPKFGRAAKGPLPSRPQAPNALDRVKALEQSAKSHDQFRAEILRAVRETFSAVEQRLQNIEEVSEGLINLAGRERVEEEVKRLHIERVEARSAQETAALEAAVKNGKVVPAQLVGDMSVVVGSEVDKDGNKLYPSRVQLLFASLLEEYQTRLRGAKPGDVIETPFASKFTVLEVFDIVPQAAQAAVQQAIDGPLSPVNFVSEEGEPLSPEAEALLVEGLADAAEQIDAEKAAVEEQLIEDLATEAEKPSN